MSKLTSRRRPGEELWNVDEVHQAVVEHAMEQRGVQTGALDGRQELAGFAQAGVGLPARQRLDGDHLAAAHVHDRLEVGEYLAAVEGVDEFRRRLVELGEHVHGRACGGDRGFGGVDGRAEADAWQATAEAYPRGDSRCLEGLAQDRFQRDRLGGADVHGEHPELHPGDPSAQVATLDGRVQQLAELVEQLIAGVVTFAAVEMVQFLEARR